MLNSLTEISGFFGKGGYRARQDANACRPAT
jgi:hypothetical protein